MEEVVWSLVVVVGRAYFNLQGPGPGRVVMLVVVEWW